MTTEQINIRDIKQVQWHDDLPEKAKIAIEWTYRRVGRHVCSTLEQWEHGFCMDLDYHREICLWVRIALAWERFAASHPEPASAQPKSLINLMAVLSTGADVSRDPWGPELLAAYIAQVNAARRT